MPTTSNRGFATRLSCRLLPLFVCAIGISGCGTGQKDDHPPRFPTRGTLSYNGMSAHGAIVTFWPLPLDQNDWRTVKPQAIVEADGSFQPNSYDLKDGAMIGEYAITVAWAGSTGEPGPDMLRGRYSDPKKPVMKVKITEGENVIPPIELKGPPLNPKLGGKKPDEL